MIVVTTLRTASASGGVPSRPGEQQVHGPDQALAELV